MLEMMQYILVNMGEIQHKGRAVAFSLFPRGTLHKQATRPYFHHGMIFGHVAFAQSIDALRAAGRDAVHAGTAPPLGDQRGFLFRIQGNNLRARLVAQGNLTPGNKRGKRAVKSVKGRIDRDPARQPAQRQHHGTGVNDVKASVQHIEARRADDSPFPNQQPRTLEIFQNIHAPRADQPAQAALDIFAVVDVRPPAPRLPEPGGAVKGTVGIVQKFDIQTLEHGDHLRHGFQPLRHLRGSVPGHGRAVKANGRFRIIAGRAGIQHGHEMIIAAAERTAAFQLSLVRHQHPNALPARGKGRAATGRPRTQNENIRLMHRGADIHWIFHKKPPRFFSDSDIAYGLFEEIPIVRLRHFLHFFSRFACHVPALPADCFPRPGGV